jgi:hypothetical protein
MSRLMQPLPLALEQPDCAVCLRNPGFLARAESSETEAIGGDRVDRVQLQLPPKKPAASVREAVLDTGQKAAPRAAVVGMESYMWRKQIH